MRGAAAYQAFETALEAVADEPAARADAGTGSVHA
jgi:hypothetical protein